MFRSLVIAATFFGAIASASSTDASIRVGWQTGVINAILTYAAETGKFEQNGVKVELKPFAAGPAMLPALAANEIDFGWMGEFPATTGFANGLPIQIVLVQSELPTDVRLVANPAAGISTLADLKGKKIGVTIGSTSHHHVLLALAAAKLEEKDVTLVNLAPAAMVPAYTAGQVDAIFTWEPGSGELEKQGGRVLATTKSLGSMTGLFGIASTAYLQKNPDEFQKFLKAWSQALADYKKDPKAVLAYEAKRVNQSVDDVMAIIARQGAIFPPVEAQLSTEYFGTQDTAATSRLLSHVNGIGKFLLEIKRLNQLPPSFEPLINRTPIAVFIQNMPK
ncbi:MAG: aliphatic sulfonate ABC transporter substrate-binding protein [Pseudorhodoplanes sp.]